jgi:MoxR-like ATPase
LFANIVLADEINRASPKTQSALLEAMEERQVSIDSVTRPLPNPFIVIATQNPVEHDGTYKLPESQLDRFLIRMEIGYPSRQAELDILEPKTGAELVDQLSPVVTTRDIQDMIAAATQVSMVEPLKNYLVDIAHTSRKHPQVALGLSPRAMIQLARAVRALAAARGRDYSTPDDVKELAVPVLAHRLVLRNNNSGLRLTNSDVIQEILASVPVPSGR